MLKKPITSEFTALEHEATRSPCVTPLEQVVAECTPLQVLEAECGAHTVPSGG